MFRRIRAFLNEKSSFDNEHPIIARAIRGMISGLIVALATWGVVLFVFVIGLAIGAVPDLYVGDVFIALRQFLLFLSAAGLVLGTLIAFMEEYRRKRAIP